MQVMGELTRFITVGISYDVAHSIHVMALRKRDLTHCESSPDSDESGCFSIVPSSDGNMLVTW
ncbi:MAG: hypothetical protein ACJA2O_004655 [Candidatus Azotimanducaceae bacterium]|jgi:hypothetical protein